MFRVLALLLLLVALLLLGKIYLEYGEVPEPMIPKLGGCSEITIHKWMLDSWRWSVAMMSQDGAISTLLKDAADVCHHSGPPVMDYHGSAPPQYSTKPVPLQQISRLDLTADTFFSDFAYKGLPVVVKGMFADFEWWVKHAESVVSAAKKDTELHASTENRMCDDCKEIGQLTGDRLKEAVYFDWSAEPDVLIWAREGKGFGGPTHFDWSCDGTLSVQYHGLKKWDLWAPWGNDKLKAHTHFQAIINESDAIWYPPAWYHGTEAIKGLSVAFTYYTRIPSFGEWSNYSFKFTPFEPCARGAYGWPARSVAWPTALRQQLKHSNAGSDL